MLSLSTLNSFLIRSLDSTNFFSMIFNCFYLFFSLVFNLFYLFFKSFSKREYTNLVCFVVCFWLKGNISAPVRYSCLSIFSDNNADTFATFLLISYCSFSSLILSSVFMISFYSLCKRFFLKRKGLSDARVTSMTKKEYSFTVHILQRFITSLKSILINN